VDVRFLPGYLWSITRSAIAFGAVVSGRSIACILPAAVIARELSLPPGVGRRAFEEAFQGKRAAVEEIVRRRLAHSGVPPEGELLLLTLKG